MPVPEYRPAINLSSETQKWISDLNGKINFARKNPNTNQTGFNPEFW